MNNLALMTCIHDVVWAAKPDDGIEDDTTPFEVSHVVIGGRHFGHFTSAELTALSKFFAQAALDLEEAGT